MDKDKLEKFIDADKAVNDKDLEYVIGGGAVNRIPQYQPNEDWLKAQVDYYHNIRKNNNI